MALVTHNESILSLNGILIKLPLKIKEVKYGYLYNSFAVVDARDMTNVGWTVPTEEDMQSIQAVLTNNEAFPLMESGTEYWSDNVGTNILGFNARGAGSNNGGIISFSDLNESLGLRTKTNGFFGYRSYVIKSEFGYNFVDDFRNENDIVGYSVRLRKISTSLSNGQVGSYSGNDGTSYPTICINGIEWLSCNLAETKYRNGDEIPTETNETAWENLSTGAKCAYNNDESNVFI
ncbi:MAG: hypothetical protein HC831_11700 [Chloroflexia bacterium]|nr:hypothetical protein [Chloroflexia bacterium]